MFSPSVPSFSVKFCWECLWTTGIFSQWCSWALPDPSSSLSLCLSLHSSYTVCKLTHTNTIHSLCLWLSPLHHQSCHCLQNVSEKRHTCTHSNIHVVKFIHVLYVMQLLNIKFSEANLNQISIKCPLPKESRHFNSAMKIVRGRCSVD